MGLFSKILKIFEKPIEVPSKYLNDLVYMYIPNGGKIKVDSKIIVPPNWVAYVSTKGAICDMIGEGKNILAVATLPITSRKNKLTVMRKNNKLKTSFKADIFFVNLKRFEDIEFGGKYATVSLFDKNYRNVYGSFYGTYSFNVTNGAKLLNALTTERAIINPNVAFDIMEDWLESIVIRVLEKQKIGVIPFSNREFGNMDYLSSYIVKEYKTIGVDITNFDINRTVVPDKIVKRIQQHGCDKVIDEEDIGLKETTDVAIVDKTEKPLSNEFAPIIEDVKIKADYTNLDNLLQNENIKKELIENDTNDAKALDFDEEYIKPDVNNIDKYYDEINEEENNDDY